MEKRTKKKLMIGMIGLILILSYALTLSAHSEEDFSAAQAIISQKIPCSELNDSQIEMIGDYYMEQIHPGDAHEYMDTMMGGEGSESLEQMHIAMAYRFYCNDYENSDLINPEYNYGMMGYNNYRNGMMGPGMMNGYYPNSMGYGYNWLLIILSIFVGGSIVALIFLLSKKEGKKKNKNRR